MSSTYTYWQDEPIDDVVHDTLAREPVARRIASLISNGYSPDSSTVYAIEGTWGEGKTSVIRMTATFLKSEDHGRWKVVEFAPWATSGVESLLAEFYSVLALTSPNRIERWRLKSILVKVAKVTLPLTAYAPLVVPIASSIERALQDRLEDSWGKSFDRLAKKIGSFKRPILVVIDDIDRLQSDELMSLLKIIRLIGRLPGINYLLAYDVRSLSNTVGLLGGRDSEEAFTRSYIEKIVQHTFALPPLLRSEVISLLDEGLTHIFSSLSVTIEADHERLKELVHNVIVGRLRTPRSINRFLTQVKEQISSLPNSEFNHVDLVASVFLRMYYPVAFRELQYYKRQLTAQRSQRFGGIPQSEFPTEWSGLLALAGSASEQEEFHIVLGLLFESYPQPSNLPPGRKRFAHPDYFDRYIAQSVRAHDVSDASIGEAIAQAVAGNDEDLKKLLIETDLQKQALITGKILNLYDSQFLTSASSTMNPPVSLALLESVMSIVGDIKEPRGSLLSPSWGLTIWAASIIIRLLLQDPSLRLKGSLEMCSSHGRILRVLTSAETMTSKSDELSAHATVTKLLDDFKSEVPRLLLADLADGDNSNFLEGYISLFTLIIESDRADRFRQDISNGISDGLFTLRDIAKRLLKFSYLVDGSGAVATVSFDDDLFLSVSGQKANAVDDVRYNPSIDTTWSVRGDFVDQYVKMSVT